MKIKKEHMITIIGLLLAGCGGLAFSKLVGISGIKNTYISSFLGVFLGALCRELFKVSVRKIQYMENIKIIDLRKRSEELLKSQELLEKELLLQSIINQEKKREIEALLNKHHVKGDILMTFKEGGIIDEAHRSVRTDVDRSLSDTKKDESTTSDIKIDSLMHKTKSVVDKIAENKNQTVVNLFLLNEKKSLLYAKFIATLLLLLGVVAALWLDMSAVCFLPGGALFFVLELKERVLTYRIVKGYFGANASEALTLLKFIHDNIDDINNSSNGGKKKILNDEVKLYEKEISLSGEVQHG